MAPAEQLDPKHLKGLEYKTADVKEVKNESGRKSVVHSPVVVDLAPEHVLSHKDYGTHIHIVTKDGRKHKVVKEGNESKVAKENKK